PTRVCPFSGGWRSADLIPDVYVPPISYAVESVTVNTGMMTNVTEEPATYVVPDRKGGLRSRFGSPIRARGTRPLGGNRRLHLSDNSNTRTPFTTSLALSLSRRA